MPELFKPWDSCLAGTGDTKAATLDCIPIVFENIVRAALIFAGIVALFFIIISGIKLLTSGGDPKAVDAAKKTLTYAIIGLVIILGSFFIISVIGYITGVECINTFGFTNCQ
jgi:hypothetical protein